MVPTCFFITLPADFNFGECLWFLDRGFDDCLYSIAKNRVTRVLQLTNGAALVRIENEGETLKVSVLNRTLTPEETVEVRAFVNEWFDLDLDLKPFYELMLRDPRLSFMKADYFGLRLIGIPDLFEAICWAIIGQQINLTFAYKLKRKLVERFGETLDFEGQQYFLFPKPEVLANAIQEELQGMQFSRSKAAYVLEIAAAFATQTLSKSGLRAMPDLASRQKALVNVKGVGVWTANYALMKSLKERSCIPHGDAGLLNALVNLDIIKDKKEVAEIEAFFSGYEGWESYLVFYLWRTLSKRV
ncbi:DNA repair protein [Pedobacter sp. PACM 27299]|uniref:DNA-3-methyladenine glycosylase family protein n=1 Tax=Pedobacter sp. PACM 27299 TaxID=1727164 RepID=UPI000706EF21|nr:DNA glycosylase [Pedobacter sp. PACM 27299]ALL08127.1 DNA repair protein [Pedobacter sp. PACM 27299]